MARLFGRGRGSVMLLVFGIALGASSLTFTHLAGSRGGAGSDDGAGAAARFDSPVGVAIDSAGAVYVADMHNHTIRKISPAGEVTTVAGLAGVPGSADGYRAHARFRYPRGITLAPDGSGVYVADTGNYTIRKVHATGYVSTIAGLAGASGTANGVGSNARFSYPVGVTADPGDGSLYVTEGAFNALWIRRITPAREVSLFAGTGAAGSTDGAGSTATFRQPSGITFHPATSTLYVADSSNHSIRTVTVPGAVVGTYVTGISRPYGIGADTAGNLYVSQDSAYAVRKIEVGSRSVSLLAGGSWGSADGIGAAAQFAFLQGAAVAADGSRVVVADSGNNTIRSIVTSTGDVSTLAGMAGVNGHVNANGSAARFSQTRGVAYYAAAPDGGWVFVADTGNNRVRKIVVDTGEVSDFATISSPSDVVLGTAQIFVTSLTRAIYTVDLAGNVALYAGSPGATAATIDGDRLTTARFYDPQGLGLDPAGNLWVADRNRVRKIDTATGNVTTLTSNGVQETFTEARDVTVDGSGNVYIADLCRIQKVTAAGVRSVFAGSSNCPFEGGGNGSGTAAAFGYPGPSRFAVDASLNGFLTDPSHTLRTIDSAGNIGLAAGAFGRNGSADGTGGVARFDQPYGADLFGLSGVIVSDRYSVRIGRPAIADVAVIDSATGMIGTARQLDTAPQTATQWNWTIVRRPTGSSATLSSSTVRNPTFTPDVADLYVFRLEATSASGKSITEVSLQANGPATHFPLGYPGPATAGVPLTVTLKAYDGFGNVADGYTGTVRFTSTDTAATLPPDYTFTLTDHGEHTFTNGFTFRTAGTYSLTARDTANSSITGFGIVQVLPGPAQSLEVVASGFSGAGPEAGAPFTLTVTARDAFGNRATGYTGTVAFSSSDPLATLPSNWTFSGADAGMRSFSVTLESGGVQSITATDTVTSSITGSASVDVIVCTSSVSTSGITVNAAAATGLTFDVTSTCAWTATTSDPFITLTTASGAGDGQVVFDVASNTTGSSRTGTITVARSGGSHQVSVTQTATTATAGDANNDGFADLFWRNADAGQNALWMMNGLSIVSASYLAPTSAAWAIEGIGDFDADGRADLLWHDSTSGDVAIWLMNGATISSAAIVATTPPAWAVQGVGDYDGDGRADILWRNSSTSEAVIWLMNGLTISSASYVASPSSDWSVQGVGDFDGDGKADILWRNSTTSEAWVWLMDGTSISHGAFVASPHSSWVVKGVGDFSGDARADLLWRNTTTNETVVWLMNGAAISSAGYVATPPSEWDARAVGDFNGDARADILWRNSSSGENVIWLMDGMSVASAGYTATVSDQAWTVAGPR